MSGIYRNYQISLAQAHSLVWVINLVVQQELDTKLLNLIIIKASRIWADDHEYHMSNVFNTNNV